MAFVLVLLSGTALADSTPMRNLGPGFQPVYSSKVRMESERIDIALHREAGGWLDRPVAADVRVRFHFVPAADETMDAGFPLQVPLKQRSEAYIGAADFSVTVAGVPLPYEKRKATFDGEESDWALWHLDFRRGQPLDLEVRYNISVGGSTKHADRDLKLTYILQTGKFWDGTIGRAEAYLTADRPLKAEDIRPNTTPGYSYKDGALAWEWRDLEPDFDLQVAMKNAWWLDEPAELQALLDKQPFAREDLRRVQAGISSLYLGNDGYNWAPVRDGRLSGEAANAMLPQVFERSAAFLKANPGDWELRQNDLRLLAGAVFGPGNPGLITRYVTALRDYRRDGGPAFPGDTPDSWARLAGMTYESDAGPEVRQAALSEVVRQMPADFAGEVSARSWTTRTLDPYGSGSVPPALADDLLAVALKRVRPAAPDVPSPAAAPATSEPATASPTGPAAAVPEMPATVAGGRPAWLPVAGAGVLGLLVVLAGGWWWWRKRSAS
jgi:hypothetical protein